MNIHLEKERADFSGATRPSGRVAPEKGLRVHTERSRNIMANEEKNLTHNIIMENRKTLSISGVTDVDNFDEKTILLYTQMGELTVQGKGLHVNSVSVETGEMTIEGDIWSLTYGEKDRTSPLTLFGKLFK